MSDPKTRPTGASVTAFIGAVDDAARRRDCREIMRMMRAATGKRPRMWGPSMVGYGSYHYRYASGREGDWFLAGFSPRKRDLTVYVIPDLRSHEDLLERLGPHRRGVCCLYLKRLDDIDRDVLRELLERAVARIRASYPCR